MKLALVGFHGSEFDILILSEALKLLNLGTVDAYMVFDLRIKRDFLNDSDKYDIVILNYIYLPIIENSNEDAVRLKDPTFLVSTNQSRPNWRKRLIDSNAQTILIFGWSIGSEITGAYLGPLEGYRMTSQHTERGSIWRYDYESLCDARDSGSR